MQQLRAATPWVFLILALASCLLMIQTNPPYMAADEQTHLQRADTFTFGPKGLETRRIKGRDFVLGTVHFAVIDAAAPFEHVKFHPQEKALAADYEAMEGFRLDKRKAQVPPGEAFSPLFYLPSAAAVAWSRHFGLTVLDTLFLARTLDALTTVGLGFAALRIAGRAQLPLFAILMLPMSMALASAVSQDGPLLGVTALGAAILSRAMSEARPLTTREVAGAALCVAMIGMAKPPYAILALLLAVAPAEDRRRARLAAVLALTVPLAWAGWMSNSGWSPPDPPGFVSEPLLQARYLLAHPAALWNLIDATLAVHGTHYLDQMVGVLGWLDTPLPPPFYTAALTMLAVAGVAALGVDGPRGWAAVRWLAPALALVGAAGVFAALYLSWSLIGSTTIEGVQGRYFLPLALFATLAVEGARPLFAGEGLRRGLGLVAGVAVLAFPIVSLVVTQLTLLRRFYLG